MKTPSLHIAVWIPIALSVAIDAAARAEVSLPGVIGSRMVVQRLAPINIWGWAEPGEAIKVEFNGQPASAEADSQGCWKVVLPAAEADAKTHRMTITGKNKIVLDDILIGDVWLGGGQSNMQMPMSETKNKEAIADAGRPRIRLLQIPLTKAAKPAQDVRAEWKICSPESVETFSAALYHFGRCLNSELHVPIGLINSSWGGSRIEWWIPAESQKTDDKQAGLMYNAMIAPLQPFALRGFIWYQGEANVYTNRGMEYAGQMGNLIAAWREGWGTDKPFYYVQLAPWNYKGYPPGRLPALWKNQVAALEIPGTGMAATIDLVGPHGLDFGHPLNKHDVGKRLSLLALNKTYGQKGLVCHGPSYKSAEIEGNKIRLNFTYAHGGLKSSDGQPLREFQIAGDDGRFVAAQAKIDGSTVVVSATNVESPTQVRFAWHKLATPNLANTAGLPATPFETRNWPNNDSSK